MNRPKKGLWTTSCVALGLSLAAAASNVAVADQPSESEIEAGLQNILRHLESLQRIADAHGNNRAAGTSGYDASADYVARRLKHAGYNVEIQPFEITVFNVLGPNTLEQTAPESVVYEEGVDFNVMDQSDPGDVEAAVANVDLALDDPALSSSGCEAEDFADFREGAIALIQRGTCTFLDKAQNAAAAGAVGAVIFNQGDGGEDRTELFEGTLDAANQSGIPVVAVSFDQGVEFANTEGLTLHIVADVERVISSTENVIAELPDAAPADAPVIVVGAHLDSVPEGPGINDNGSGSASNLELALALADAEVKTDNRIRFGWWGAEEIGLIGAEHYVSSLSDEELAEIALNLNYDMVGSPNYARFVYDGDGSDTETAGPAGSDQIEQLFLDHFASQDLETLPTAFDGRSDYGPFIAVDIPAGGLFTGAEGIKSEEEAEIFGGTAGEAYDPCYHQACDDINNINEDALREMTVASVVVLLKLANSELPLVPRIVTAARAGMEQNLDSFLYKGGHLQR